MRCKAWVLWRKTTRGPRAMMMLKEKMMLRRSACLSLSDGRCYGKGKRGAGQNMLERKSSRTTPVVLTIATSCAMARLNDVSRC